MKVAFGVQDDQILRKKKLPRQGSRSSVRSSHSVKTPIVSRKDRLSQKLYLGHTGGTSSIQIGLMPSLKK